MMPHQTFLAGTSFYDMKAFLQYPEFPAGLALVLRREPGNQYDANAIEVLLERRALAAAGYRPPDGREIYKLGHVPAKDGTAAWLAPLLDAGHPITATFHRHGNATGLWIELHGADEKETV